MNRNVFSLLLNKAGGIFISLISRGNMFQKVGPETRKLRGPKVIVFVRGMTKSPRAADLRFARFAQPDVSDTLENISVR
jgi:hypothetical protein